MSGIKQPTIVSSFIRKIKKRKSTPCIFPTTATIFLKSLSDHFLLLLLPLHWLPSTCKGKFKFFGRAYMWAMPICPLSFPAASFLEHSVNYQNQGIYSSPMLSFITFMPLYPSTSQTWINLSKSKRRHHFPVPASLSQQLVL